MGSAQHLPKVEYHPTIHLCVGESNTQAMVDAIEAYIAVVDRRGRILMINWLWKAFARANGDPHPKHTGIGVNCLDVLAGKTDADDSVRDTYLGIEAFLQRRCESYSCNFPGHTPNTKRWFKMAASPLRLDRGGVVLAHDDITERHTAQRGRDDLINRLNAHDATLRKEHAVHPQELSSLDNHACRQQTKITSHLYGAGPLKDTAPQVFDELVGDYAALLPLTVEHRTVSSGGDLLKPLQAIVERIGSLDGGPRDIVDLHARMLRRALATAKARKAQVTIDEARLLLIKLLGYLAAHYRRLAVGRKVR